MASTAPTLPNASSKATYLCDTLPAARLASRSPSPAPIATPPVTAFAAPILDDGDSSLLGEKLQEMVVDKKGKEKEVGGVEEVEEKGGEVLARKLCVRHQRMADEGTNLKLQQVN